MEMKQIIEKLMSQDLTLESLKSLEKDLGSNGRVKMMRWETALTLGKEKLSKIIAENGYDPNTVIRFIKSNKNAILNYLKYIGLNPVCVRIGIDEL